MNVNKTIIGAGRFLRLVERDRWEYVERTNVTGIVAIAALTDDHRLLLVEQFRLPVGRSVIELPAGLCGDELGAEHEPLTEAARRELLEETGYEVATSALKKLAEVPSSSGLTNEIVTIFGAKGVRKVGAGGGVAGENIIVHQPPLDELDAWLADCVGAGRLIDAKLFVGLHFLKLDGFGLS